MTETVTPNIAHLKKVMTADQLIEFLADKLEAERQRADKAELELIKPLPIGELIQRLEGQTYEKWFSQSELKGEQAPVGEIVAWAGTDREKGITREVDFRFLRFDVQPGTQLFTAPQKPVVLSFDAWCKSKGENPLGWVRETMKEAYDAAIETAGCIVKGGKLLGLREVNHMKEKCLTCGKEMSDEPDSLNLNCAGDCLECMASHGDLDCISAVARIKARKRDAGSNGTEA